MLTGMFDSLCKSISAPVCLAEIWIHGVMWIFISDSLSSNRLIWLQDWFDNWIDQIHLHLHLLPLLASDYQIEFDPPFHWQSIEEWSHKLGIVQLFLLSSYNVVCIINHRSTLEECTRTVTKKKCLVEVTKLFDSMELTSLKPSNWKQNQRMLLDLVLLGFNHHL